jgi:hypothetical protein
MHSLHRPSHAFAPRLRVGAATVLIALVTPPLAAQPRETGRSIIPVASQWPGARPGQVNISADGRYVTYQANRGDGWKLFLHEVGQPFSREIAGLGDTPYYGIISPSGRWLLFGKKGWIWKAPIEGGEMSLMFSSNHSKVWETDETFLITKGTGGVWRVKADGSRQEEQVAAVDTASGAVNYQRPALLPGGKGVLVSVGFGTGVDLRKIGVVSLPSGKLTILDEYGIHPRYAESGHILYTQGNTVRALPFDLERLQVTGPSATVVEGVHVYGNLTSQFDISRNGVLVYVPGPSDMNRVWPTTLVWVDRLGRESSFDTPAEKTYGAVRMSPDRRFLAAEVGAGLHLFDRQSGTWSVLSEGGNSGGPVWSRDSKTLYYSKSGVLGRQPIDTTGAWEEVWRGDDEFWAFTLSLDGNQLLGADWIPETGLSSLAGVSLDGTPRHTSLLGGGAAVRRNAAISPDGRWIAYVERAGGLDRVYVQPYPGGGSPVWVSEGAAGEAAEPIWSRSSSEVF